MQLASGTHIPDGLLAVMTLLSEKPRHGVESNNPAPHPGIDERNSTLAIGFRASLALDAARESERARYYSENDARFLTPDPSGLMYAQLTNPQSLNLYNYVGNDPLSRVDLMGLCWKGFKWACDAGNGIKHFVVSAKNKIRWLNGPQIRRRPRYGHSAGMKLSIARRNTKRRRLAINLASRGLIRFHGR